MHGKLDHLPLSQVKTFKIWLKKILPILLRNAWKNHTSLRNPLYEKYFPNILSKLQGEACIITQSNEDIYLLFESLMEELLVVFFFYNN
jgi:hypothetical protein